MMPVAWVTHSLYRWCDSLRLLLNTKTLNVWRYSVGFVVLHLNVLTQRCAWLAFTGSSERRSKKPAFVASMDPLDCSTWRSSVTLGRSSAYVSRRSRPMRCS